MIKRQSIEHYMKNAGSRSSFRLWLGILKQAEWSRAGDILDTFGTADLFGNGSDRVVFNIGGNHYRMICTYHFGLSKVHVYVKWIGTHGEHTELCSKSAQYFVTIY